MHFYNSVGVLERGRHLAKSMIDAGSG